MNRREASREGCSQTGRSRTDLGEYRRAAATASGGSPSCSGSEVVNIGKGGVTRAAPRFVHDKMLWRISPVV